MAKDVEFKMPKVVQADRPLAMRIVAGILGPLVRLLFRVEVKGIEKLPKETWSMDKEKGYIVTWGEGAPGAGEVGLAAIFNPAEFAGFAENELDRFVKLARHDAAVARLKGTPLWQRAS